MWGRPKADGAQPQPQQQPAAPAGSVAAPQPIRNPNDLLRRAEWDRLADADREALMRPFQGREAPKFGDVASEASTHADLRLQDWVAQLISSSFQPQTAAYVRAWLSDGSPDGHLYVGGFGGQGRTSLVASLARQVLVNAPVPVEYCYVPDLDALGKPMVLAVPDDTGANFTDALQTGLRLIAGNWDGASSGGGDSDSSDNSDNSSGASNSGDGGDTNANDSANAASNGAAASQGASASAAAVPASDPDPAAIAQQRGTLVTKIMDIVTSAAPSDGARAYVAKLTAALQQLASKGDDLPFAEDSVPTAHVTPTPDSLPGGSAGKGAPVVVASLGQTDLSDALLRANGGVLILAATDTLDSSTWNSLSTALRNRSLLLKQGWPPIPLSAHVVMIGSNSSYAALVNNTEDFSRIFRYEIWCNYDTEWKRESEATYAALASGVSARHSLPAFDPTGVARLVEEGARRVDGLQRTRLSTDLLLLHDLALQAGRVAKARNAAATSGQDVDNAIFQRRQLQTGSAERVRYAILSGQEMTATFGAAMGQINGLGIYEVHPSEGSFAVPMRISAIVSVGKDYSLLDVERGAEQADAEHIRGLMTMEGYLANRYGQDRPVSLSARIRFEQQHGGTGGDSASAAELFALLSALAQVPIRRSVAVTGAVGQYGEIQPIGGVNIKIEGFFDLCRARRAAGEQPVGGYGAVIPAVNTRDLMLRPDVAYAIAQEGWFSIWPINWVDEGIPLLMGVPAEQIHARVNDRLKRFYELATQSRK
ncbi:MAG TPA: AAA family ATPase [Ktedonobacterales bacterium]|nr:AAA family ATPase [Ktedonobacterales bacterium]